MRRVAHLCTSIQKHHSIPALLQRRPKSFKMFIDSSDPTIGLERCREMKRKLQQMGKEDTANYLQCLVNIAICHYQLRDLVLARECAIFAHDEIIRTRGPRHTYVFFSATTVAKISGDLADEVEQRRLERQQTSLNEENRLPRAGVRAAYAPKFAEQRLREESQRFSAIAKRVRMLPEKHFLRGAVGEWDDDECSNDRSASDAEEESNRRKRSQAATDRHTKGEGVR